jgi:phage major head subunit gpT-like protein
MNRIRNTISFVAGVGAWVLALVLIALAIPLISAGLPAAHTALIVRGVLDAPHVFGTPVLMAGMIVTPETLTGLGIGFKTTFNGAFNTAESKWQKVAMSIPSSVKANTYAWLGLSTRFREWLGDRVVQNLKAHAYSIVNKIFENTIGVRKTDITDDEVGVYTPLFQQLGYDAKVHPDELLFDLVSRADAVMCYDGQNFFDTDHPVIDKDGIEQSVSNFQAGAQPLWVLMDASKPIKPFIVQIREAYEFQAKDKPDDDNVFMRNEFLYGAAGRLNVGVALWQLAFASREVLSAANYKAAYQALLAMEGDQGKKLNVTPTVLLVGPTNFGAANALIKAQKDAAGADNIWFATAEVVVVPWLE